MHRIIDSRGNGKTKKLMFVAKDTNSKIACLNPWAMSQKAKAYGITGVSFISYDEYLSTKNKDNILIDELENFVNHIVDNKLVGYTLSNED